MLATGARQHHDGQTLDDEQTAVVMALGARDRERSVRVRRGAARSRDSDQPFAIAPRATGR